MKGRRDRRCVYTGVPIDNSAPPAVSAAIDTPIQPAAAANSSSDSPPSGNNRRGRGRGGRGGRGGPVFAPAASASGGNSDSVPSVSAAGPVSEFAINHFGVSAPRGRGRGGRGRGGNSQPPAPAASAASAAAPESMDAPRGRGRGRGTRGGATRGGRTAPPDSNVEVVELSRQSSAASDASDASSNSNRPSKRRGGRGGYGSGARPSVPAAPLTHTPQQKAVLLSKLASSGHASLQAGELSRQLIADAYECSICAKLVKRSDAIWSCGRCYVMLHQHCVLRWYKTKADGQEKEINEKVVWNCPLCNLSHDEAPKPYLCFCGKVFDPTFNPGVPPHSCGNECGRASCPHPCTLQCHPGCTYTSHIIRFDLI